MQIGKFFDLKGSLFVYITIALSHVVASKNDLKEKPSTKKQKILMGVRVMGK